MKPISKKFIVIVALVGVLVLAAAIVVAVLHKNSNPAISIVGTWYSDKPDILKVWSENLFCETFSELYFSDMKIDQICPKKPCFCASKILSDKRSFIRQDNLFAFCIFRVAGHSLYGL